MSTTSTSIFSGTSRFSNDFQQVITRAVSIASLPISQLNNTKNALSDQAAEVTTLQSKFASLSTALSNLGSAAGSSSLSASVSDIGIARVTLSGDAAPASYSLEVVSIGSYSNSVSSSANTRVTDPTSQNLSAASAFTLTVNGTVTHITPASTSLNSLVSAINDTAGASVHASLVNVGSSGSPDYRLSLQSATLGPVAIQLNDGSADLLQTASTGSLASYKINGLSTAITSTSRTVTLAPGISAELVGPSAAGVASTINVTRNSSTVSSALSAFVTSYNAAADELEKNRGKSGGALAGNSVIQELSSKLRAVGAYTSGSGNVSSLASLGITFDGNGHLSFDASTFGSAANNLSSVFSFLGTPSTGGFSKAAADIISSVTNTSSGVLTSTANLFATQIVAQQARIDANQARVDQLKTNLQAQLAKADAKIAALEQSYSVLSGIIQAQLNNNKNQ